MIIRKLEIILMLHNQWLLTMLDSGYEERRCCAHEKMQVELLSCWVAVQGMIFKKGGWQKVSGGHHCNIRVLTEIQPEIGLGRGFVSLVDIKCNQCEYKSQSEESHEDKSQSWKEVGFWKEGQLKAMVVKETDMCNYCENTFLKAGNLRNHKKRVHSRGWLRRGRELLPAEGPAGFTGRPWRHKHILLSPTLSKHIFTYGADFCISAGKKFK